MNENTTTQITEVPEKLKGRVALVDGVLHWSLELKGSMELDEYIGKLSRKGVVKFESHKPEIFNKTYSKLAQTINEANDNDIKSYAITLIGKAYNEKASDIHITNYGSYAVISLRRLGMMQDFTQLDGSMGGRLIQCIYQSMSQSADTSFSPSERQDGRIVSREYLPNNIHSIRIHTEPIQSSYSSDGTGTYMALRLLFDATQAQGTLEQRTQSLGFTEEQQMGLRLMTQRTGLNIISGPTGHGKTTLLKQVMESMANDMPERNHLSIEDPPEYPLEGVKQILVNSKTDSDEEREWAYTAAIAGAMRSDPDTMMVGEIRYRAAAHAAISAALTGHGVWATIHATNALAIISRFVELGISLKSLCNQNVLSGLTYQRLLPILCPECKIKLSGNANKIPEDVLTRLLQVLPSEHIDSVCIKGSGCIRCNNLGLIGQTVAAEVIPMNHRLLGFLRNDDLPAAYNYWINDMNGITHVAHTLKLISLGLVDPHLAEIRLGVTLDYDQNIARGML